MPISSFETVPFLLIDILTEFKCTLIISHIICPMALGPIDVYFKFGCEITYNAIFNTISFSLEQNSDKFHKNSIRIVGLGYSAYNAIFYDIHF